MLENMSSYSIPLRLDTSWLSRCQSHTNGNIYSNTTPMKDVLLAGQKLITSIEYDRWLHNNMTKTEKNLAIARAEHMWYQRCDSDGKVVYGVWITDKTYTSAYFSNLSGADIRLFFIIITIIFFIPWKYLSNLLKEIRLAPDEDNKISHNNDSETTIDTQIIERYLDKIGGFDNFHGSLFSRLPLSFRIDILWKEYIKRPTTKVVYKMMLAISKSQDKLLFDKWRGIFLNDWFDIIIQEIMPHCRAYLKDWPTMKINIESSIVFIKSWIEEHSGTSLELPDQANILLQFLYKQNT